MSTSYAGGTARPVIAVALAPNGSVFNQAMYAPVGGLKLPLTGGPISSQGEQPVPGATSDQPASDVPLTRH